MRTVIFVVLMLALALAAGLSFVLPAAARGETASAAPQSVATIPGPAQPAEPGHEGSALPGAARFPAADLACAAALSVAMGLTLRRCLLRGRTRI